MGDTRLLRSGGPCIRLTQLGVPCVSRSPPWTAGDSQFVDAAHPYPQRRQDPAAVDEKNILPGNCPDPRMQSAQVASPEIRHHTARLASQLDYSRGPFVPFYVLG